MATSALPANTIFASSIGNGLGRLLGYSKEHDMRMKVIFQ
jgi:hypothetical protein